MNFHALLTRPFSIAQLFGCATFAVSFLRSGIDMAIDRQGNLKFLRGYLEKTPLRSLVPALLVILCLMEILAGGGCALGALMLLAGKGPRWGTVGMGLSALCLVSLFLGQQIAKDHDGAAKLMGYCALAAATLIALGL